MNYKELTASQIEEELNSLLSDINIEDSDESFIRNEMIHHIKNKISYEVCNITHTGTEFYITVDDFKLVFKTSVKKTDKIVKITKLKNAYVKVPNKVKLSYIRRNM